MSERKVLNKYYPPDFDPSKIPRLHLPKDRQYTVRLMAPCNMKCKTCGEYIYKGKKFNARKETVHGEEYLGIKIFRFYIKCTRCLAEITFKTDPKNADYIVEHGATRNFQALKLAEEAAEREQKEREEEESSNPMKLLENRTKASKREMDIIETLEELRELNQRQARVDYDKMLDICAEEEERRRKKEEEEENDLIRSLFGRTEDSVVVKRILDDDDDSDEVTLDETNSLNSVTNKSSSQPDILTKPIKVQGESSRNAEGSIQKRQKVWERSIGAFSLKKSLSSLVTQKKTDSGKINDGSTHAIKSSQATEVQNVCSPSGLNLLGTYSDSDDSPS